MLQAQQRAAGAMTKAPIRVRFVSRLEELRRSSDVAGVVVIDMFVTGGGPLKPQYDSSALFGWVSSLSRTSHAQTVLHLEDPSDFARADLGDLAVRWVIDDSEQHRSAVLHDCVDWVDAHRLHAGKVPLVP